MPSITYINAVGSTIISALTIICATYLLVDLIRQARGKLRVRLLVGMVVSDVALGLVALPTEILYLAGGSVKVDTPGCDAQGFLITTVLFTQHLWTLAIAIATFLLLKFPLSTATTIAERYSWASWPIIWGLSVIHSAIWHVYVGWSSGGNLCYYDQVGDPASSVDGRDLVQFIPRALVFITILVLYSTLFQFLRRPDTIQISTQFVSGGTPGASVPRLSLPTRVARMGSTTKQPEETPPWERLEFASGPAAGVTFDPTLRVDESTFPRSHDQLQYQIQSESSASTEIPPPFSDETPGETLQEFFQSTPANPTNTVDDGRRDAPISAAAYFNRQASLLMLYFPLAYLVVFSASLVRLVYDMIWGTTAPVLSVISAWMVLSVGLIDAAVYGLAEFMVKRRVRRKMPDRM